MLEYGGGGILQCCSTPSRGEESVRGCKNTSDAANSGISICWLAVFALQSFLPFLCCTVPQNAGVNLIRTYCYKEF